MELWQGVPHVPGPGGRHLLRKAMRTRKESDVKFWDFARQFFIGIWGSGRDLIRLAALLMLLRPLDTSALRGDTMTSFVIMRSGGWYYNDRLGLTLGPSELIQLKCAWGAGMINKDTFIWVRI